MKKHLKDLETYRNCTALEIVEYLREVPGKNDKVDILKIALSTNESFKAAVICAYDTFYVYGIKDINSLPEFKNHKQGTGQFALQKFCERVLIQQVAKRGSCDAAMKNIISKELEKLSDADIEVVKLILKRNFSAGFSKSSINKAMPGLIAEFPVMLCDKANEKTLAKMEYPAIAQTKMDGLRTLCFLEDLNVTFRTRNAKVLQLHNKLDDDVRLLFGSLVNCVLDGELVAIEEDGSYMNRRKSNGLGNKAIKGTIKPEDADRFVFIVWDVIPLDSWKAAESKLPYDVRFNTIKDKLAFATDDAKIRLVETIEVDSYQEAFNFYMEKLKEGEEGIILKNKKGLWNGKRSKDCLKFKVENTADLVVTGVHEGAGKYTGHLGALQCESADGIVDVNVGTGFSDLQRQEYFTQDMVGKIIEVKYNEVIANKVAKDRKSLFLPVFSCIREDKDVANTVGELK